MQEAQNIDYENMDYEKPIDDTIIAIFRKPTHEEMLKDEYRSSKEGRTIYVDQTFCEIRIPADRNRVGVFPAHAVWQNIRGQNVTYAMRFNREYQQYLKGENPSIEGTPLEDLPFVNIAKRYELKALNVFTAEQLAGLEGNQLKNLGMGGRELKEKAKAFIDVAKGTANITKYAAENATMHQTILDMQEQIARMQRGIPEPVQPVEEDNSHIEIDVVDETKSAFHFWTDDDLRRHIGELTGEQPHHRCSHETLVKLAEEAKVTEPK